jgi:DNA-binding IclR family transcriptional regulator
MELVEEILKRLVTESGQSAEILTVNGKMLYWYDVLAYEEQGIRAAAQVGFKRTLYELDAPARLFHRHRGIDKTAASFDQSSFYTALPVYTDVSWEKARTLIEAGSVDGVEYDLSGNRNSMRRFVTLIQSPAGEFLYLLSLVEPALRVDDEKAHVARNSELLLRYREKLMGELAG